MTRREGGRAARRASKAEAVTRTAPVRGGRDSPDAWTQAGRPDIRARARARARVREILASSPPLIPAAMEEQIARRFPIRCHHAERVA